MEKKDELILAMMEYDCGMTKQIQHFLKVYEFASLIGKMEKLPEKTQKILELSAIVHDIGIRKSLEKYGSSAGKYQEEEGPDEAEKIMKKLKFTQEEIERVKFLVAHHHTYSEIDGPDYQILVEADFLVNLYEDAESSETIAKTREKIFKTPSGCRLLKANFALGDGSEI